MTTAITSTGSNPTISFGGLATGLDTNSIISELMAVEKQPITLLQNQVSDENSRLAALTALNSKLQSFSTNINNLDSTSSIQAKKVDLSSSGYFSASATGSAQAGSYNVEVDALAQVEKQVSQGVADQSAQNFGLGTLTLTVGSNAPVNITIDSSNNSLSGIVDAINNANAGVTATVINDGTGNPYRLSISGDTANTSVSLTTTQPNFNGDISSSLTTGGYADQTSQLFGSGTVTLSTGDVITLSNANNSLTDIATAINAQQGTTGVSASVVSDGNGGYKLSMTGGSITSTSLSGGTGYDAPSMVEVQPAQQAHIKVDTIDIYSDSNTISGAISGITMNLTQAAPGTTTTMNVSTDQSAIEKQVQSFVSSYNSVVSYVTSQSVINGSPAGILDGDSGMNAIKRHLQDLLVTTGGSGSITSLSQLGIQTQEDGTLTLDTTTLDSAIQNHLSDVTNLLAGDGTTTGVATQFKDYLSQLTDPTDGFLKGREDSINSNIQNLNDQISNMQYLATQKQQTLEKQFTALETMVSTMNSQSSYLTQALKSTSSKG